MPGARVRSVELRTTCFAGRMMLAPGWDDLVILCRIYFWGWLRPWSRRIWIPPRRALLILLCRLLRLCLVSWVVFWPLSRRLVDRSGWLSLLSRSRVGER